MSSMRLSIRRGDQEVASVFAGEVPQRIGRSKQCEVVLDDPAISRVHAVLSSEAGRTLLTDQDSQNGLWVQGRRASRVVLDPSVVVAMGPFRIVCEAADVVAGDETVLRAAPGRSASGPLPADGTPAGAQAASPTASSISAGGRTAAVPPVTAARSATSGGPAPEVTSSGRTAAASDAERSGPKSRAGASLADHSGDRRTATLLVAAILVIFVAGAGGTALFLKWRSGGASAAGDGDAATDRSEAPPASAATTTPTVPAAQPLDTPPGGSASVTSVPAAAAAETAADRPASASSSAPGEGDATAPGASATATRPTANELPPDIVRAGKRRGESYAAWARRSRELTTRLNQGKGAIDRGDFAAAIEILTAIERDEPNFGDTTAQLTRARERQRARTQARAQAAFDEGQQKERQEDFAGAIQSYEQAERLDPELSPRSSAAIAAARTKLNAAIDQLYAKAKLDFTFNRRAEAIQEYQRLLKLMPEDDPRRSEVQARLQALGIKE